MPIDHYARKQVHQDQLLRDIQERLRRLGARAITTIVRDDEGGVNGVSDDGTLVPIVPAEYAPPTWIDPFRKKPGSMLSTGSIILFAGAVIPTGWLICDATMYDGAVKSDLYAVIGNTYNDGTEPPGFFRVPLLTPPLVGMYYVIKE